MRPLFSIITPTLQRESLIQTCDSIDKQDFDRWEHIVIIDREEIDKELMAKIAHPQRTILKCEKQHRNGGNTCRHNAWRFAVGRFCWYVDDDNVIESNILGEIFDSISARDADWFLFPITRLGGRFYTDPPRSCHVDTMNVILKRHIAQWPDTDAYGSDGVLVDSLMERKVPYTAFPNFRPIAVIPVISGGR